MRALEKSQLAVGIYPEFSKLVQKWQQVASEHHTDKAAYDLLPAVYDARGGGGIAEARLLEDGRLHVIFDPQTVYIPDVSYKSAKFLVHLSMILHVY